MRQVRVVIIQRLYIAVRTDLYIAVVRGYLSRALLARYCFKNGWIFVKCGGTDEVDIL